MATTSLSLGPYWEKFIKERIAEGRYGSASEVVREALRTLEQRETKLAALRDHVMEGARQADAGEYVEDFSIEDLIEDMDKEFE
jgi:antitoxin ParD1/3/4